MRLNDRFSVRASVLIISVLASPGTPSSRQWPRLNSEISSSSITCVLADDHLGQLLRGSFRGRRPAYWIGRIVGGSGRVRSWECLSRSDDAIAEVLDGN